jgi:hypothetical protein
MRFYFVGLFIFGVYTVLRLTKVTLGLHTKKGEEMQQTPLSKPAATMRHLRSLHYLFLLIFGGCFASEFFGVIRTAQNSAVSLSTARIEMFEPLAAFAFLTFATLSCLHALQWFVSSRVHRAAKS